MPAVADRAGRLAQTCCHTGNGASAEHEAKVATTHIAGWTVWLASDFEVFVLRMCLGKAVASHRTPIGAAPRTGGAQSRLALRGSRLPPTAALARRGRGADHVRLLDRGFVKFLAKRRVHG